MSIVKKIKEEMQSVFSALMSSTTYLFGFNIKDDVYTM